MRYVAEITTSDVGLIAKTLADAMEHAKSLMTASLRKLPSGLFKLSLAEISDDELPE